jgi:hypothetical protein
MRTELPELSSGEFSTIVQKTLDTQDAKSKEIETYSIVAMLRKETGFCTPCEYGRFICWKNVGSSTPPFN